MGAVINIEEEKRLKQKHTAAVINIEEEKRLKQKHTHFRFLYIAQMLRIIYLFLDFFVADVLLCSGISA